MGTRHDPFGRVVGVPAGFTREHRIQLLDEVFRALVDGSQPSREAALFVGGGGLSWLAGDGDLLRDCWQVSAPRSSHRTASRLWRELRSSGRATTERDEGTIAPVGHPESSDP